MLASLESAYGVMARKKTRIAEDLEIKPQTLHAYLSGLYPIPPRRYAAFDRAIGAPVNWDAYLADFEANRSKPNMPPKMRGAGYARPAPQTAAQHAPAGNWGLPSTEAQPGPVSAQNRPRVADMAGILE